METSNPQTWLAEHGDFLFRVARRQFHSDELAEHAVQETLLAAVSAPVRFAGQARLRIKTELQRKLDPGFSAMKPPDSSGDGL